MEKTFQSFWKKKGTTIIFGGVLEEFSCKQCQTEKGKMQIISYINTQSQNPAPSPMHKFCHKSVKTKI